MKWIDKTPNRVAGQTITHQFLENHCKEADGRYREIKYDDRCPGTKKQFVSADKRKYRKAMIDLLLTEQNNLCCYCLRKLKRAKKEEDSDEVVTIEHIIPRGYTSADNVAYYQSAPGLGTKEVVMRDVYEDPTHNQIRGCDPHNIAFNNMTVSGNGTFPDIPSKRGTGKSKNCCNEFRREKEAYPIYFFKEVGNWVDYLPDGDIQAVIGSPEEQHVVTLITNTNLQFYPLKDIRYLWYMLRNENWRDITDAKTESARDNLFSRVLYNDMTADFSRIEKLHTKYIQNLNWDTFFLYSAFYDIFRSKYP